MSVHDRPTASELIEAVREYLRDEVVPAIVDRRARFRALIAENVLAIVGRELANADGGEPAEAGRLGALGLGDGTADDVRARLCARIRAGGADDQLAAGPIADYARAQVLAKLHVSNPRVAAQAAREWAQ
ncbi:MAG: DUF6285 domain-containing protein [Vulcanimicrobiaceae bacterium]